MLLCLYNVDTLKICMKEFGSEKIIFDKMKAVRTETIFPGPLVEPLKPLETFNLVSIL